MAPTALDQESKLRFRVRRRLSYYLLIGRSKWFSYSCNGRCGAGCTGVALGNAYTQDCFSHDICSYFNNASGGARCVSIDEL